ncbi:MAG: N-acetylneuraminate synthase [Candidatus Omnitrophica bacterium]|nr:N-acetylneuraminate synthase [Candidatus Omnitrophota bacterium]
MNKVFIIAEAGVNHNGDIHLAKKLVDAAKAAGADAVKFQTFKSADFVVTPYAKTAVYQAKNTSAEFQHPMLEKLRLTQEAFREVSDYCRTKGILFLSTPFDLPSVDFLKSLGMKIFKIPSGEITNLPYLRKIGRLKKKTILSTGMADLREIKIAIKILMGQGVLKKDITVLHCHTDYPTRFEDVNLRAMLTIQKECGVNVGYSDHTLGTEVAIAAVVLGARVIEKHFTLDRNLPGPDQSASLEPGELKQMISAIRHIEQALGDGKKKPTRNESKNLLIVRRSLYAAKDIAQGERFTEDNIVAKRPAVGLSPMLWDKVIGQRAQKNYKKDDAITLSS